ncbi:MAG: DUF374 domain-containing protein, partial [Proteobacteria bacterium]|nr:DUF374 domain-containing protein [Pseudomonadota bacterium]
VFATCRLTVHGQPPKQPAVYAIWHQQLFAMPLIARQLATPLSALMSASRDGRFTTATATHFAIGSIAGSSHRGGSQALRDMLRALQSNRSIAITPDGPRGPANQAKPGAPELAKLANAPLIPVAAWCRHSITIGSWDSLQLPLPFSHITLHIGTALPHPTTQSLTAALNTLTAQAKASLKPSASGLQNHP